MRRLTPRNFLLLLFALMFLLKAYYLDKVPIYFDGTLYGEMIAEEAEEMTFLPKYLGAWAPWKPGLFFIAYSLFLPLTSFLFDSIDWIYKSPNLLFGLLNALLFYLIAKRFVQKDAALAASLLFYSSYLVFYAETRLLMETFTLFTILLSVFFYTWREIAPWKRFLGAAAFAFLASLTKSVISFMIIPLAIAYMFQKDRAAMGNPLFLLSLLAPFLGFLLFYLALDSVGLVGEVLVKDTGKFFVYDYANYAPNRLMRGFSFLVLLNLAYIVASIRKLISSWRDHLFFSAWLLISLIPAGSGVPMPWHFYYVAPPIAFFVALSLLSKGKMDTFSLFLVPLLILPNLGFVLASDSIHQTTQFDENREVGLMLSGKENVLIVGYYGSSTVTASYKLLSERRDLGAPLDFGYIVLHWDGRGDENLSDVPRAFDVVVEDYYTEEYEFVEGEFAQMFQTTQFLRKNTSIEKFDYIAVSPAWLNVTNPCYVLYYNGTSSKVYMISEEPGCR